MTETTSHHLDDKLAQFATRLHNLRDGEQLGADQRLRIVELDEKARSLRAKLRAKLQVSRGVDWELLKLELKNDLLLLTNSFRTLTRRLDDSFNRSS